METTKHQASVEKPLSQEGKMKKFEYKDAQGNIMCVAEVTYSSKLVPIPGSKDGVKGREVLSYMLSKPGSPKKIDLFRLTEIDRFGYRVFVADKVMINTHNSEKRIICADIESPLGIPTFLHEAGHAEQFQDPIWQGIAQRYELPNYAYIGGITALSVAALEELAEQLGVKNVPNIKEALTKYQECGKRYFDLRLRIGREDVGLSRLRQEEGSLEDRAKKIQAAEQAISELAKNLDSVVRESVQILKEMESLIRLPQRMLERDATRRALIWMEQLLREEGINLFAEVLMPESKLEEVELAWMLKEEQKNEASCESSVQKLMGKIGSFLSQKMRGVKATAKSRLQGFSLASYGASDEQMREAYGFIPELKASYADSSPVMPERSYDVAA